MSGGRAALRPVAAKFWRAIVALTLCSLVAAVPPAADRLTLERLFDGPSLDGRIPRAARLSPDGRYVAALQPSEADRDRMDLWLTDATTGAARLLVDSAKAGSGAALSDAEKMRRERLRIGGLRGITALAWAPDSRSVLFTLDGDVLLAGVDGDLRRITRTPATEIDPHPSGAGRFVSFGRDGQLVVWDARSGTERIVSPDGGGTVSWGLAEFVAQEEMGRYTGQWWAPDDSRIAVERVDEAPVRLVPRAAIGAGGTTITQQRYPIAGTPNAQVQLWTMRPDGSARVRVDLGPEPDIYLARVDWSPDGRTLYVQRQDRAETHLDLLRVDPATGASRIVFTERAGPRSWVNLSDDLRVLADGDLIWWSERDGHGHLYLFSHDRWGQLTRGAWEVKALIGVDEARGRLFFTGNRETPLERQAYALDYVHGGEPVRLTERGWMNDATMDEAASRLLVTRSNPDQPPQLYVADTGGRRLAWVSPNALTPDHPYHPYLAAHRPTRFGTLTAADGSTLYWEMITPPLVPGRRYPVFFQHYGGPTVQQVTRSWSGALPQYWVGRGWIYFQIDNRGSANRGKAFEDQIWHHLGGVEVDDQVAAARWLKSLPFVDPARVATYGWSYGGFMTLKMLEQAPGVFAAGVAGAPVTAWRQYDTHATERFLGDPSRDLRPYEKTDPLADAARIRDPLLMIHGMADDNVGLEQATAFYAALQAADIPFRMMLYPGMTHHISGAGPQAHLWHTIEDFLDDTVKDRPPHPPLADATAAASLTR